MTGLPQIPADLAHTRTTAEFTDATVPKALLRAHKVAAHVWARLRVYEGVVRFVFEDPPGTAHDVAAGDHLDIPPSVAHRVEPAPGSRFAVEFFTRGS